MSVLIDSKEAETMALARNSALGEDNDDRDSNARGRNQVAEG